MAKFATPEEAVLAICAAFRKRDLGAVIACKDFRREALVLLSELGAAEQVDVNDAIVSETAATLEAAFRAEIGQVGFPARDMSEITGVQEVEQGLVTVREEWQAPAGSSSSSRVYVGRGEHGWRVLHPVEEPAA